jgi:transposase InsO family protein
LTYLCKKHAIKHKLTKFRHPWTNGQVERINRTIKDATTKTYHYDSINQFEKHLQEFVLVCNFAKRLKSLKFKMPFEFLAEKFKNNPTLFYQNPDYYSKGLNNYE